MNLSVLKNPQLHYIFDNIPFSHNFALTRYSLYKPISKIFLYLIFPVLVLLNAAYPFIHLSANNFVQIFSSLIRPFHIRNDFFRKDASQVLRIRNGFRNGSLQLRDVFCNTFGVYAIVERTEQI